MENHIKPQSEREDSIHGLTKTIQNPYSTCQVEVNGKSMYDFSKCISFLDETGKSLFGKHFSIDQEDYDLIHQLLLCIIGDQESARRRGLALEKGILLTGPVGCGKTSIMKLIRFFQAPRKRYSVRSCRDVSFGFIKNGYQVIHDYSYGSSHDPLKEYCFDDLGTENNLKYYGNECNVMGEILLTRYELMVIKGMKTHVTTNCNSSELEDFYGVRVRSRMREMFNLIAFDRGAKDKRV